MSYRLGVHLGTTSVAAAAAHGPRVDMLSLSEDNVVTPSAVYLRSDGVLITGELAVRHHHLRPDRVARELKRRLGDETPIMLGGASHAVPVLLAQILKDVVATATAACGRSPEIVVLTHPASWGPFRREVFGEVPRLAGLSATRMVTEPQAAAVHYDARRRVGDGEIVVVYHLGGGTCEITVLRRRAEEFAVLGPPESLERLGGIDVDEAILGYVNRATHGALAGLGIDDQPIATRLARLRQDCVVAKEALSMEADAVVPVFLPARHLRIPLTRSTLEGLIRPLLDTTMHALRRALASADIAPDEVSAVFLTGGSTRIPLVGRMISDVVECPAVSDPHPEFVVALGAARLAAPLPGAGAHPATVDAVDATAQLVQRRASTAAAAPAAAQDPESASGDDGDAAGATSARALPEYRAARIAVLTVLAVLVLATGVAAGVIVSQAFAGAIGAHRTSTFIPTLTPTSGPTSGR